jgi:hypothetical protein
VTDLESLRLHNQALCRLVANFMGLVNKANLAQRWTGELNDLMAEARTVLVACGGGMGAGTNGVHR